MDSTAEELASLVEFVVTPLVDHPDEVDLSLVSEGGRVQIEVRVDPSDAGQVIKSIRTLVRAAASRKGVQA